MFRADSLGNLRLLRHRQRTRRPVWSTQAPMTFPSAAWDSQEPRGDRVMGSVCSIHRLRAAKKPEGSSALTQEVDVLHAYHQRV